MLRRVGRVLRVLLFVIGTAFLISIPLNWLWWGSALSTWPFKRTYIHWKDGCIQLSFLTRSDRNIPLDDAGFNLEAGPVQYGLRPRHHWWPEFSRFVDPGWVSTSLLVPLWLLAFLCLAWPVTSFIVARRKRRRGFPVEPTHAEEMAKTQGAKERAKEQASTL